MYFFLNTKGMEFKQEEGKCQFGYIKDHVQTINFFYLGNFQISKDLCMCKIVCTCVFFLFMFMYVHWSVHMHWEAIG